MVVLYGALRVYWQLGHMPARLSPIGPDLVVFTGWEAVALCAAAALILVALMTLRLSGHSLWVLLVTAWAVGVALVTAGALLLLDMVGGILPGMGIPFYPLGALSKAACVGSGILLARAARAYQRRSRQGCDACGRAETMAGRAAELVVGTETVKTHVGNVLAKLESRDRTQAVITAYESGFVSPS